MNNFGTIVSSSIFKISQTEENDYIKYNQIVCCETVSGLYNPHGLKYEISVGGGLELVGGFSELGLVLGEKCEMFVC